MNAEEFKSAFLPLGPMLYRIAYRMLGAEEDARDAVQELYVKLCREGDRALRSANPQGYCVRMMQNVCADILRRGGRNVLRMAADVTEVRGGPAVEAADAPVEGREEAAMVRKALAALPRKLETAGGGGPEGPRTDGNGRDRGPYGHEPGQYPGHALPRQKDVERKNSEIYKQVKF